MWTSWIDQNAPDDNGEHESVTDAVVNGTIHASCHPVRLEARDVMSKELATQSNGLIVTSSKYGIYCSHKKQKSGRCPNFEIRVCCNCK